MGGSGLSAPFWGVCVHCCDASFTTRAAPGGTSAPTAMACRRRPLSVGTSPLVEKADSTRAAPPRGWRLRRGVNPHKPPRGQFMGKLSDDRTVIAREHSSDFSGDHPTLEIQKKVPNAHGKPETIYQKIRYVGKGALRERVAWQAGQLRDMGALGPARSQGPRRGCRLGIRRGVCRQAGPGPGSPRLRRRPHGP